MVPGDIACGPVPDHLTCDLHLHHRLRVSGMEMHAEEWLWILKKAMSGNYAFLLLNTLCKYSMRIYMQAAANP